MRRMGEKGTNRLTLVHKLVGFAWVVAVLGALVVVVPGLRGEQVDWARLTFLVRAGAFLSVATLVLGIAYAATVWGFLGSRLLLAKWGLYLVAVSASGYSIRAAREHSASLAVLLAAAELLVLLAAMGVGVYLERSRHAGRLPRRAERG